jgi:Predicted membrane protein (DUF2085)
MPGSAAALPPRIITAGLAAAAAAWLLLLIGAPYLVSHARPRSAIFDLGGLVYLAGRIICHQRADRSLHAWGVQLPVCARCTGLYAGAFLGSVFAAWRCRPQPGGQVRTAEGVGGETASAPAGPREWRRRLAVAAAPTAASVGLEMGRVWAQSPRVRGAAAIPLGFVVAWFVAAHVGDLIASMRREMRPR